MGASAIAAAAGGGGRPPRPVPVPRAPLGPFPQPVNYHTTLGFTPPAGPDLHFYRGNFCGLTIPGAPVVPGCNGDNPETIMPCLLDNYPLEFQKTYLNAYAEAGYTHLQRSIGHSLYYGGTVQSHAELSNRAQGDYGLFCDEWFLGGEALKTPDQDAEYWRPILLPIIDQLLAASAIDHACVGWQLDQLNEHRPGNALISIITMVADALPREIPVFTHWMNEALAWWKVIGHRPDGSDIGEIWSDRYGAVEVVNRFTWWYALRPYLTGGHHQGDTTMARTNPKLYTDKMADTLDYFAGRPDKGFMGQSIRSGESVPFSMVAMEYVAQDVFDGDCSELEGDGVGYLLMCMRGWGDSHLGGYGNGARMPDGSRL